MGFENISIGKGLEFIGTVSGQVCIEFQSRLDATEQRGVFADTPWIPAEMKEVVERVIGCEWFPENTDDIYRYPPRTSTS